MRGSSFIPKNYDVFTGLDVSKKSMSVTFTNHQGFIRSLNMPHKAEPLLHYVRKHFPDQKIAFVYEAGPTGYGLYDGLAAQAHPCLIAAPSMIPRAPGQRVKTNRLDSKALSESLRGGQLKSIHIPSPTYRQLRHLTQLRDVLVSELAGMKQRIKSLLLFEGIEFPPAPCAYARSKKIVSADMIKEVARDLRVGSEVQVTKVEPTPAAVLVSKTEPETLIREAANDVPKHKVRRMVRAGVGTLLVFLVFVAVTSVIDPQNFLSIARRGLEVAKHNLNQWVVLVTHKEAVPKKASPEVEFKRNDQRVM